MPVTPRTRPPLMEQRFPEPEAPETSFDPPPSSEQAPPPAVAAGGGLLPLLAWIGFVAAAVIVAVSMHAPFPRRFPEDKLSRDAGFHGIAPPGQSQPVGALHGNGEAGVHKVPKLGDEEDVDGQKPGDGDEAEMFPDFDQSDRIAPGESGEGEAEGEAEGEGEGEGQGEGQGEDGGETEVSGGIGSSDSGDGSAEGEGTGSGASVEGSGSGDDGMNSGSGTSGDAVGGDGTEVFADTGNRPNDGVVEIDGFVVQDRLDNTRPVDRVDDDENVPVTPIVVENEPPKPRPPILIDTGYSGGNGGVVQVVGGNRPMNRPRPPFRPRPPQGPIVVTNDSQGPLVITNESVWPPNPKRECTPMDKVPFRSLSNEDEAIYEIYYSNPSLCDGVVVELSSAKDSVGVSPSYYFEYALNWKTILIEANPDAHNDQVVNRSRARHERGVFCPAGVSSIQYYKGQFYYEDSEMFGGEIPRFSVAAIRGAPPVTTPEERKEVLSVPCRSLKGVFDGIQHIDVFYMSTSGDELETLRSMEWNIRVSVWVIELDGTNGERDAAVRSELQRRGYVQAEWDVQRWCPPKQGHCLPNEVWLERGFNPLPITSRRLQVAEEHHRRRLRAMEQDDRATKTYLRQ